MLYPEETRRIFDRENPTSKRVASFPAFANNGVLDLTKINVRGGVHGQKEQEHNYTTEQPH